MTLWPTYNTARLARDHAGLRDAVHLINKTYYYSISIVRRDI